MTSNLGTSEKYFHARTRKKRAAAVMMKVEISLSSIVSTSRTSSRPTWILSTRSRWLRRRCCVCGIHFHPSVGLPGDRVLIFLREILAAQPVLSRKQDCQGSCSCWRRGAWARLPRPRPESCSSSFCAAGTETWGKWELKNTGDH